MEPRKSSAVDGVTLRSVTDKTDIEYLRQCREILFAHRLTVDSLHPTEHLLGESDTRVSPSEDTAWPVDAVATIAELETDSGTEQIGCCVASIKQDWQMHPHVSSNRVDYETKMEPTNAWVELLYVEPAHRNSGVGTELLATQLDVIEADTDASTVFMLNWHREAERDAERVLQSTGFEHVYDSEYYFETVEERTCCPDCEVSIGDGDYCGCSASVWRQEV